MQVLLLGIKLEAEVRMGLKKKHTKGGGLKEKKPVHLNMTGRTCECRDKSSYFRL